MRPPAPPRRTVRRAAASSAGLLVAGVLVGAAALAGPAAAATTPPTSALVAVSVGSLTPAAPAPGQRLQVTGSVTNRGTSALAGVNVQLRLSTTPVGDRSEMATLSAGTGRPPGDPVATTALAQPLQPGASAAFTLGVAVDQLGLAGPGVYPLAVEAIADDPTTAARTRVGTVRTFLPWDMSGVRPTRLAVVWPVSAGPTRDTDGVPLDDVLHDQVTGRLEALLSAADGTDVTWLVDGDTVEAVSQLAAGAPRSAGSTATAAPDPAAAAWLERLVQRTASSQVLALPFADPDVVSVVRAGLAGDLATAGSLGRDVTTATLKHSTPTQALAWPAEGTADGPSLTALAQAGFGDVLLTDTYTPTVRGTSYTPSGVGPLTGTGLTAVVADATLSRLLSTPAAQVGGPVLGRQRMLAELAMVGLELPSVQRSLVVVPPRSWTPDPAYVQSLLQSIAAAPWARVAPLSDLTAGAAAGPARQRPSYPASVRRREIDPAQMTIVREAHGRLASLTAVLSDPQTVTDTYTRALLRAQATTWRTDRAQGRQYATAVDDRMAALQTSVHLIQSGPVTLAARSGRIPLTVVNELDQQVTVQVGLRAVPSVRLSLVQPPPVVVEAHSSTTLEVAADATTNGSVQVVAQLLTTEGDPFGTPQTFTVQVTGFGAVAELLVGGALVLLTVALVLRIVRAIRTGRRPGSPASVREPVR